MKKLLTLILFLSLSFAREYIAVIDFEGINVSEAEAKALSQNLTSEIIALNQYTVVERSAMKRIMDEQKFQHSGCVDTQCAVDIGKILGAKYIIVGSVGKVGKTFSIDARMIEVETGESYQSANYKHKGEIDVLLMVGMKSVAYQLAGLEYEPYSINNSIVDYLDGFSFLDRKTISLGISPPYTLNVISTLHSTIKIKTIENGITTLDKQFDLYPADPLELESKGKLHFELNNIDGITVTLNGNDKIISQFLKPENLSNNNLAIRVILKENGSLTAEYFQVN